MIPDWTDPRVAEPEGYCMDRPDRGPPSGTFVDIGHGIIRRIWVTVMKTEPVLSVHLRGNRD